MRNLEAYAQLIVHEGVNIKAGQPLFITSNVENYEFVRLVTAVAYTAGAREVFVRWVDDVISRLTFLRGADDLFTSFPDWQKDLFAHYDNSNACYLAILSNNPEALKGVDANRLQQASISRNKGLKSHSDLVMANKRAWCVTAVPGKEWACKVFPNVTEAEAMEKLWDAILLSSHAHEGNAVAAWQTHVTTLAKRADILNNYQFTQLHYKNSLGTDLVIGLPQHHIWTGGVDHTPEKHPFSANIPTEEIFTAPHRLGVNGRCVASMPLVYQGDLIEGFEMTFKDGKVVSYRADKNEHLLKNLLDTDEGARYLGEVALVPHNSPISNQGILFYNTLFDENASCHLAVGEAYPTCVENGVEFTLEQRLAAGLNDSLTHVDFMIGTSDLSIVGTTPDGTTVDVFCNGNFAF